MVYHTDTYMRHSASMSWCFVLFVVISYWKIKPTETNSQTKSWANLMFTLYINMAMYFRSPRNLSINFDLIICSYNSQRGRLCAYIFLSTPSQCLLWSASEQLVEQTIVPRDLRRYRAHYNAMLYAYVYMRKVRDVICIFTSKKF